MTVNELIDYLEEFRGMEVRLGVQPSYPFECAIEGVVTNGDLIEKKDEEVCYILQGMQLNYASKELWEGC